MGIGSQHKILLMFGFGPGINSTPAVVSAFSPTASDKECGLEHCAC